jgi:hypothetical protein
MSAKGYWRKWLSPNDGLKLERCTECGVRRPNGKRLVIPVAAIRALASKLAYRACALGDGWIIATKSPR